MSELIAARPVNANARWQLLTTVSALTLCGAIYTQSARAEEADRPTVWIELGGQLERVESKQTPFLPAFTQQEPLPGFDVRLSPSTQSPPRYALGGEAKAIFAPEGTDWSFLAAVRFGRSNSSKHEHRQISTVFPSGATLVGAKPVYAALTAFGDTASAHTESHAIVDFMAGRDVGLGFLGNRSTTIFDIGIRFAQFNSKSTTTMRELPDPFEVRVPHPNPFLPNFHLYATYIHHHTFYADENIRHSFSGIGPTISLNGSSSLMGNPDTTEVAFDWGANAALLFGRQTARGNHKTAGYYLSNHYKSGFVPKSSYGGTTVPVARSRSVIVPNVGGFAGLTLRRASAKVSLGYRADFFFGAMDGGIDNKHASNVGFFGPFATVSIGLGG